MPQKPKSSDAVAVTPALLRSRPLPVPAGGSKDERGRILVIGGAPELPGAAILAATGALRAGAGKLQIATCASIAPQVGIAVPEALVLGMPEHASGAMDPSCAAQLCEKANKADATVFGPGIIENDVSSDLLAGLLSGLRTNVVLDAAALACVGKRPRILERATAECVLTPHAGEMAALLSIARDRIESDPRTYALRAAERFASVVALKGAQTYIATPSGDLFCNTAGTVGLATSGSGDILAGVIGGLLARGLSPLNATLWGVYAHAKAGAVLMKSTGLGFLAREIPQEIPMILRRITLGASSSRA
ncbi:MAG: NAD(P)H-hydrate dehydratase [Candidatus Eremiobacteraeota bacterium]|nr:NAD(P)H-hydrate dehydratase [Candidatus Eremiobacteraeota bacterium]